MESSLLKTSNTKRFVIEDSITKVTSDGEPHEMMTMIAGLSGLLAAIVILTVLIFLVTCKKTKNKHECDKCTESGSTIAGEEDKTPSIIGDEDNQSKCSSTATIINPLQGNAITVIYDDDGRRKSGNLQSNLNKAFEGSELNLHSSLERPKKPQKKTHWQDEMEMQRETSIQIERY